MLWLVVAAKTLMFANLSGSKKSSHGFTRHVFSSSSKGFLKGSHKPRSCTISSSFRRAGNPFEYGWSYNSEVSKRKRRNTACTDPGHKPGLCLCVCVCCVCFSVWCASSHAVGSSVCSTLVRLATGLQLLSVSLSSACLQLCCGRWAQKPATNKQV